MSWQSGNAFFGAQGATFVYEAVLAPIVKILRREIAKNPSLDKTLNGPLAQGSVSSEPCSLSVQALVYGLRFCVATLTKFLWLESADF